MSRGYVTPDKEGLLSFLDNLVIEFTEAASTMRGNKKAFELGTAEGVRQARIAVANWHRVEEIGGSSGKITVVTGGYERHEYKPDFTKTGDPCDVCGFGRNNAVHQ